MTTVVIGFLMSAVLTGCTHSEAEAEARSAEQGRTIHAEIPDLVRAAGWDSIGQLTEKSCLGTADPEEAARETKWIGSSSASDVPQSEAMAIAEGVARDAEQSGWTPQEGTGPHGDRLYGATKEDLTLVVTHQTGGGRSSLSLAIHSPCLEMPAGHVMTRSELDPMYGSSDPLYPNDDRSKFTNGEPKPLPTGS
ncbi:hypothetical protein F7P69_12670 [Cellulosimicrobium funkei]|nr:hypothetical protein [Cellulosimicrobium funkei]